MKCLIVNADDYGASCGINRGVEECFERGILTSASLMVNMPAATQAAHFSQRHAGLSLGLHTVLTTEDCTITVDLGKPMECRNEILRQLAKFQDLRGCNPSHLDSHHNVHRDPVLGPIFEEVAREYRIPLREHSPVRYFSNFYGQWEDGESHLEWIGVDNLKAMLEQEVREGITELACHPGYRGDGFQSSYLTEREYEVTTLCDSRIAQAIQLLEIRLTNYTELVSILVGVTA